MSDFLWAWPMWILRNSPITGCSQVRLSIWSVCHDAAVASHTVLHSRGGSHSWLCRQYAYESVHYHLRLHMLSVAAQFSARDSCQWWLLIRLTHLPSRIHCYIPQPSFSSSFLVPSSDAYYPLLPPISIYPILITHNFPLVSPSRTPNLSIHIFIHFSL